MKWGAISRERAIGQGHRATRRRQRDMERRASDDAPSDEVGLSERLSKRPATTPSRQRYDAITRRGASREASITRRQAPRAMRPHTVTPPLRRLPANWSPPSFDATATDLTRLPIGHQSLEPPEFSWVGETGRHIGTVVHAALESFASATDAPDTRPDRSGPRSLHATNCAATAYPTGTCHGPRIACSKL